MSIVVLFGQQANTQVLSLNEYMPDNAMFADSEGEFYPWIEVRNPATTLVDLSNYSIVIDSSVETSISLPAIELQANETAFIWLSGKGGKNHTTVAIDDFQNKPLLLIDRQKKIVDYLPPHSYSLNEAIIRNPDFNREWVFVSDSLLISPGAQNPSPGPWRKIKNRTDFVPGDSGPFGCALFQNKMWILDYETIVDKVNYTWAPLIEVWCSDDGLTWELKCENPPYSHNGLFVAFNGYLWAFDGSAYRSTDGVAWEKVASDTPYWGRITVFKEALWVVQGSYIYRSDDGINWKMVREIPWVYRPDPALLEHNGMLYVYGGGLNYGTDGDEIYLRDVWRSKDGVEWELVNEEAEWGGSVWFTYASFDNKLWMIGGYNNLQIENNFGNNNEVWFSSDGKSWERLETPHVWEPRHAQFTWVKDNALWISAGYGGGGAEGLFNDVWKFSKLKSQLEFRLDSKQISTDTVVATTYGHVPYKVNMPNDIPFDFEISDTTKLAVVDNSIVIKNAGQATITISHQENDFVTASSTVVFDITKKDLLVTTKDNYKRYYMRDNPQFLLEFSGFVKGDTVEDLDSLPKASAEAGRYSPPGTYPIKLEGGFDDNYTYVFENKTLEVLAPEGSSLTVFPNPARESLHILLDRSDRVLPMIVSLFDSEGKRVFLEEVHTNPFLLKDIKNMPDGFYYLCVVHGSEVFRRKIMIIH